MDHTGKTWMRRVSAMGLLAAPAAASSLSTLPVLVQAEVHAALAANRPVVALESTIISHGMPYPENVATAKAVEAVVRENGAVPATIAIMDGKICVGLDDAALEQLGRLGHGAVKTSRRDLAAVVASGRTGATTVSGTMLVANMVGIRVFATGGIGGVHRGAESSMDVSADLTELGRSTGVAVVCAGVKSILDIGRTLEFLETQGVTVVGFGQENLPAFFTPDSGHKASIRLDSPHDVAALIHANNRLAMGSGIVIGVPIPAADAADAQVIERATARALREADEQGVGGKEITPFLLQRVNELTGGSSLTSNIALIKNNAATAARIAVRLARITPALPLPATFAQCTPARSLSVHPPPGQAGRSVFVAGGLVADLVCRPARDGKLLAGTSNPGTVVQELGGVARNVAEVLARLGVPTTLLAAVGADAMGDGVLSETRQLGVDVSLVQRVAGHSTAVYAAVFDEHGDLSTAIAAMDVLEALDVDACGVDELSRRLADAAVVVLDANLAPAALRRLVQLARAAGTRVVLEPVSVAKGMRAAASGVLPHVDILKPNVDELAAMCQALGGPAHGDVADQIRFILAQGTQCVIVSQGARGVLVAQRGEASIAHFAPERVASVVNTSGAGDSFVGGLVAGLAAGRPLAACVPIGLAAARLSVQSRRPVSEDLSAAAVGL